jgi:hypothetical protein
MLITCRNTASKLEEANAPWVQKSCCIIKRKFYGLFVRWNVRRFYYNQRLMWDNIGGLLIDSWSRIEAAVTVGALLDAQHRVYTRCVTDCIDTPQSVVTWRSMAELNMVYTMRQASVALMRVYVWNIKWDNCDKRCGNWICDTCHSTVARRRLLKTSSSCHNWLSII